MHKTMYYILIHFTEAENILLTTEQIDYKLISPEFLCYGLNGCTPSKFMCQSPYP